MKKTFLLLALIVFSISLNAQKIIIKKGTTLIYDVGDGDYTFKVRFTEVGKTVSFNWEMTNKDSSKGSIVLTENALAKSKRYINYLKPGNLTLNMASTVILSKLNFTELQKKGQTKMSHYKTEKLVTWTNSKKDSDTLKRAVIINGKVTKIACLATYNIDEEDDAQCTILVTPNCNFPLITYMQLDFDIELKEVINYLPNKTK
jgi:hypothetical protein